MTDQDPNLEIDPNWTPPVDKKDEPPAPDPVAELKAQLEQERNARVAAERRANDAAQTAHSAQLETADNQLQLVVTAIDRVKENTAALKAAYAEAMRQSDFEAAAEIQSSMSDNAAKLLQLENGKAAMEAQPKAPPPKPIQMDPVEALASQLTARSAAWVRAHPECARDPKLYQKMIAAHNLAVADGIAPDSDEYFQSVEATVFAKPRTTVDADDGGDPMSEAAKAAPARQSAPPAAPVSRGSSNGRGVRLSAAEREAAEMSGMSEEAYAAAKEDMKKQGRIH
jgi:hypothetical protein